MIRQKTHIKSDDVTMCERNIVVVDGYNLLLNSLIFLSFCHKQTYKSNQFYQVNFVQSPSYPDSICIGSITPWTKEGGKQLPVCISRESSPPTHSIYHKKVNMYDLKAVSNDNISDTISILI